MKKFILLALVLVLGACGTNSDEVYTPQRSEEILPQADYISHTNKYLSGEITISTFDSDMSKPFLEEAARLFMYIHEGTIVNVESFSTPMTLIELEGGAVMSEGVDAEVRSAELRDYISRINTELMSGRGPDILNIDVLPFHRYATSGQLVDLRRFVYDDPNFDINAYRLNIIDAVSTAEGLFKFPLDYIFTIMSFDSYLMTEAQQTTLLNQDVFTLNQLINIALPTWENRNEPLFGMCSRQTFRKMFDMNYSHFINIEGRQANFADGTFVDMLNQIKEYEDTGILLPAWGTPGWDQNLHSRRFYSTIPSAFLLHELFEPEERFIFGGGNTADNVIAGLLANNHGQVPFTVGNALAINSNSNNQELAWEFIKFASSMTDSMQFFSPGLSVHLGAFEARARREVAGAMWNTDWVDTGLTEAQQSLMDKYTEMVERFTSLLNTYFLTDAALSDLVYIEVESNFLTGSQNAEDIAQTLQSRINLFLNE